MDDEGETARILQSSDSVRTRMVTVTMTITKTGKYYKKKKGSRSARAEVTTDKGNLIRN